MVCVLEEVQNQQSDRDRFKQIARGGDSAGNFPSWGIKETNDLAEPELHMLVHNLAVKQGTNQRLAIMGHTRNSNQREDCSRSKLYQPLDQSPFL